ncbi:MAG: efflux RND transporter periplasmic adaptor subunit [Bacteroidales bacterium]|nr:efflux RND transporter periplasmic adaptor subunit [Bacteroidales bacterium]
MKKIIALAVVLAFISGCSPDQTSEKTGNREIRIKTAPVRCVKSGHSLGYSGTVEASQVIPLSFRTVGTVEEIFVETGDRVSKGQLLATLDDTELQNIYHAALSKYKQAEDAYNRLKQVYEQGSLPEIKWVEMQTSYDQAGSSLELAKNNLEKCRMLSPVEGIVGRRNIEPGQSSLSLTSAPIELVRIEKVSVKISVPENEINKIREGEAATVRVAALDGKSYEGTVTHISPVAELMSRTYTVKINLENPGNELKPGMVCDTRLDLETGRDILVVPKNAVSKDPAGITYVFVVASDNKTVRKQPVRTGRYHENGIEILEGLSEGQTIVSEGNEKLSDNSKISL